MSRAGYSDDGEFIHLYRGSVDAAIRGRRGQALLRDMAAALDAMEKKELIRDELLTPDGEVCALGATALYRGQDRADLLTADPGEFDKLAQRFNVGECLAREVMYENDECGRWNETPAERWARVRKWVAENLKT